MHHITHPSLAAEEAVIFDHFPLGIDSYRPDVAAILQSTVERFGLREWRATVLSGELHGHLGIYTILGVKMGIRVLELFDKEGQLEVTSYAGAHPPISCLNDGLQVATGATLGHGAIRIAERGHPTTKVLFRCGEESRTLELLRRYDEQLQHDISEAKARYGNLTPRYREQVRQCALRYWTEWDRKEIFAVGSLG